MSSIPQSEQPIIEQTVKMPKADYDMVLETNRMLQAVAKNITGEKWLNCEEAARYIKKSVSHLRGELKDQIGYSKPDRELLFKTEDLDRWLMKHYRPGQE